MSFLIRKATLQDQTILVQGQIAMALESEGLHLKADLVSKGVAAVLNDSSKGTYWIAEESGNVAGCLLCIPEWSDWRNATVLWIHSVYTWPQHRKKGVYRALYGHLKEEVERNEAFAGIRLYVEKKNKLAQRVYTRLGMSGDHYHLFEWLK